MKITLGIEKIEIKSGDGSDHIMIFTNLPPATKPCTQNQIIEFKVAKGDGAQYIRENFGIEPNI